MDQIHDLLRQRIDHHRVRVAALESEIESERAAMEKYRAALAVIEELPGTRPPTGNGHGPAVAPLPSGVFPQSIKYGALEVLRRHGGAMTLMAIADEMLRSGFEYGNNARQLRTTVGVTLERWKRKGMTDKVATATYRLSPKGMAEASRLIAQNMGKA